MTWSDEFSARTGSPHGSEAWLGLQTQADHSLSPRSAPCSELKTLTASAAHGAVD